MSQLQWIRFIPVVCDYQAGQGELYRPSVADSPCPKGLTKQTVEERQYTNES